MRTITVAGHGVTHAVPDVAVVHVAAVHPARTLPEALAGAESAGELVSALADEVGERLRVDQVGLEVGDPGDATRLAREAAFADARARAEHLATLAGAMLGAVESIAEGGSSSGRFAYAAAKSDVSFEAGETAIEQTLTVTFELL